MAEYGTVPDELFEQDIKYWNVIINIGLCEFNSECDSAELYKILRSGEYREEVEPPEIAQSWIDLILPKAYAWTESYHSSSTYGKPYSCDYGTCQITTTHPYSIGQHNISAHSNGGHGINNSYFKIYGSTCGISGSYSSVVVNGDAASSTQTVVASNSGNACAIAQTTWQPFNNNNTWLWTVSTTTNSWTN